MYGIIDIINLEYGGECPTKKRFWVDKFIYLKCRTH